MMFSKFFVVFSTFLIAAQAGKERLNSQAPDSGTRRVIGGSDAVANQFPHQISFQLLTTANTYGHYCGGVIIDSQWILTAAHCLDKVGKTKMRVKAGTTNLKIPVNTEQVAEIAATFGHEQYNKKEPEVNVFSPNDIGLLKLKSPLILNEAVNKISLPKMNSKPSPGSGVVSGWGSIARGYGAEYPDKLQHGVLSIIDNETCNRWFKQNHTAVDIPRTQFCTQTNVNNKVVASCSGDSGGPLVQRNKTSGVDEVIGIVSWATVPCDKGPSVFTTVAEYIDWIQKTMMKN